VQGRTSSAVGDFTYARPRRAGCKPGAARLEGEDTRRRRRLGGSFILGVDPSSPRSTRYQPARVLAPRNNKPGAVESFFNACTRISAILPSRIPSLSSVGSRLPCLPLALRNEMALRASRVRGFTPRTRSLQPVHKALAPNQGAIRRRLVPMARTRFVPRALLAPLAPTLTLLPTAAPHRHMRACRPRPAYLRSESARSFVELARELLREGHGA
jgi:hypothetical protein